MHQQTSGFGIFGDIRQHKLHALEISNRFAELFALFRILNRRFQPGAGNTDCQRADAHPTFIQHAHHNVKAAVFRPQQRVCRQPDLVEMQFAHLR